MKTAVWVLTDTRALRDKAYNDARDIAKSNCIYAKYLRDALDVNI